MDPASVREYRVLIVPGLHGSGPAHWQTRWEQRFPWFERVVQRDWDVPDLQAWSSRIGEVLRESARPALVVAHSFGCLAAIHRAGSEAHRFAGALLVAPADPDKFGIGGILCHRTMPCPAIVVGSLDDPWMEASRAADWAATWGCGYINAGRRGHINADSGLGNWEAGLDLLGLVANRLPLARCPELDGR